MIGLELVVTLEVVRQVVEVALHRVGDLPDEEHRGDHRQHREGGDDRPAVLEHARDHRAQRLLRGIRPYLGRAAQLLVDGEQRGHQQEGAEPAEEHADPADEPEVPEPAVGRDHEHAEGDAGGRGGEQGGARSGLGALQAGFAQAHALPAKLFQTREIDEPVVDAVAHHDGAEEGRLGVQVADHQAGEPEGDAHGHQDGQPQRGHRPDVLEEKED